MLICKIKDQVVEPEVFFLVWVELEQVFLRVKSDKTWQGRGYQASFVFIKDFESKCIVVHILDLREIQS